MKKQTIILLALIASSVQARRTEVIQGYIPINGEYRQIHININDGMISGYDYTYNQPIYGRINQNTMRNRRFDDDIEQERFNTNLKPFDY